MDLGSASKFTLEWYSFSNRLLKRDLLQICFNITKLLRNFERKWPPSPRPVSQSECRIQQKCCHLLEKKAAQPMRMQDFQSQQHHMATKAMRMQDFQSQQTTCWRRRPLTSMDDSSHNKTTCYQSVTQCWQSITCYVCLVHLLLCLYSCALGEIYKYWYFGKFDHLGLWRETSNISVLLCRSCALVLLLFCAHYTHVLRWSTEILVYW